MDRFMGACMDVVGCHGGWHDAKWRASMDGVDTTSEGQGRPDGHDVISLTFLTFILFFDSALLTVSSFPPSFRTNVSARCSARYVSAMVFEELDKLTQANLWTPLQQPSPQRLAKVCTSFSPLLCQVTCLRLFRSNACAKSTFGWGDGGGGGGAHGS